MKQRYVIAGLGNPGKSYDGTRHNVGFALLDVLAKKFGLAFSKEAALKVAVATGEVHGAPVILLKPLTFMNLSGEAIRAALAYWKIDAAHLLVVVDDIDLPFGAIRLKVNSGPGTHNGLRNIEDCLQTNRYPRLKIGVGDPKEGELTSFVLGKFSSEEEEMLPKIFEKVRQSIEIWLSHGLTRAMDFANRSSERPSNPSNGE